MTTVAEPIPQEHVRHTKTRAKFEEKSDSGRNFAGTQRNNRPKEDDKQRGDTKSDGKQHRDADKGSRRRDRRFHDLEPAASYTSEELSTEPYDCIRISSVRNELFTTLDVICPRKKGIRKIKLKVGTGAAGNTLPLRTYKQMYKTSPPPPPKKKKRRRRKKEEEEDILDPQGTSSWLPTTVRRSPV